MRQKINFLDDRKEARRDQRFNIVQYQSIFYKWLFIE